MKSFEEQFPSLKDKEIFMTFYQGLDDSVGFYMSEGEQEFFIKRVIEKYCLDKERVRQAIMELIPKNKNTCKCGKSCPGCIAESTMEANSHFLLKKFDFEVE